MKDLERIFKKYNIEINPSRIKQFDDYFDFLIETNKSLNLTAITDENEVIVKHFLDSVLPYKFFPKDSTIVDIGSGAGFPAIPLKIIRPDLKVCMVDSLNKRINFLKSTIDLLGLEETKAIHSRVEDFAKENRQKFDVVVARAVAELDTLVEYLLPLIKIGGLAIIYKSSKLDEELVQAKTAIKILGGQIQEILNFNIEEGEIERKILILKKVKLTPTQYPRDKNKPKTNPIK